MKSNPEVARKMSKAVLRALAWIREHPAEEILARVPAEFHAGDSAEELAAIRLAKPTYSLDGRIRPESAAAVRRVLSGSLSLNASATPRSTYPARIRTSFAVRTKFCGRHYAPMDTGGGSIKPASEPRAWTACPPYTRPTSHIPRSAAHGAKAGKGDIEGERVP